MAEREQELRKRMKRIRQDTGMSKEEARRMAEKQLEVLREAEERDKSKEQS